LKHDPEKCVAVFRKRSCSINVARVHLVTNLALSVWSAQVANGVDLTFATRPAALHAVAFEDPSAGRAEMSAPGLKALLDGVVIAEILAAKALGIARACGLLLLAAHMLGLRPTICYEQNR
jgi:hypothetical protein